MNKRDYSSEPLPPVIRKTLWVLAQLTVLFCILGMIAMNIAITQFLWELLFG